MSEENDCVISQFNYIKELAEFKFNQEEKREQSLIQQSSQMQTVFSFLSASVFMVLGICLDYNNKIPKKFLFVSTSIIIFFILVSLLMASIAQWRYKRKSFPDIQTIKKEILENSDWKNMSKKEYQMVQYIDLLGTVQKSGEELNNKRSNLIILSMISFYCSIGGIFLIFFIAILMLL